jgi:hypothetical protein
MKLPLVALVFAVLASFAGASTQSAPQPFPDLGVIPRAGGFRMEGYWVWCGSVIKGPDGKYHMFASRWPRDLTFHPGWMTNSEVVRAVADRPDGPYEFKEVVLPARGAEYWDGRATHNPSITRSGDTYILFYMGSTHPFDDPPRGKKFELSDPRCIVARSNKRIGIATAKSLEGPWTRYPQPALDTKAGTYYSFLTSNPAPVVHEDGSVLLMFKSRRYDGHKHSQMMLGLARAKHFLGPYEVVSDGPLFSSTNIGEVEDPFMWKTPEGYELVVKDMSGKIVGEHHAGVHARSKDGLHWTLSEKPKAWSRTVKFDDGITQTLGQLERPFVLFENGQPTYLFAAAGDGPGGFANMTETHNLAIPLVAKPAAAK